MRKVLVIWNLLIFTIIMGGCSTKDDLYVEIGQEVITDNVETIELQNSELQDNVIKDDNLKSYLNRNHFHQSPDNPITVAQLETLEGAIDAYHEGIKDLEGIQYAVNITELNCGGNEITTLPETIGNLTNLEQIILYDNRIESLPETIGNLTNLDHLNLDNNRIESLPETIGNLTALDWLQLKNNQIKSLPETIGNLTNLRRILLGDNQIKSLPETIGNLTNLKGLYLENNQIKSLPETIGNLTNLEVLFLDNNQIKSLPETIGNLTNLIELSVGEQREPRFDFGDTSHLEELTPEQEAILKEQIWDALLILDFQTAADIAYNTIESYALREDSDFETWYEDVYTVAAVQHFATSEQASILSSFRTPRFQAVFPTYTSVLTLATIVDDPDSLLPIDVETAQVLEEEVLSPKDCYNISPYIDKMLIHFKSIYKAEIIFYRRSSFYDESHTLQEILIEDKVTAYVGIFNNGQNQLLGYYGECDDLKTDAYWESKRLDYASNPYF